MNKNTNLITAKILNGILSISIELNLNWETVTKSHIEKADGRRKKKPRICKQGSYLYVARDKTGIVLYVGETSKSIKRRFRSDGSASHKHKDWYKVMTTVDYIVFKEIDLPTKNRRMLEQALSISLEPQHYT